MMTAGTRVIKDQAALDKLLVELYGGAKASLPPASSVDFSRETVLAVSSVPGTPCNRIQIEDVRETAPGKLKVSYRTVVATQSVCIALATYYAHVVALSVPASKVQSVEFLALPSSTSVDVTTLDIGTSSGVTTAQNRLITDQASFATLLQTHLARSDGITIDPASVNFSIYSVVGVFLGNTPGTPTVDARIERLSLSSEGVLYVRATAATTSNASAATPVTQAFHLVRANVAPGAVKEVVFHVEPQVATAETAR